MAHYAKIVNNKVVQVIVAEPEFFNSFIDTEPGEWVQTSYNSHGGVHYGEDGTPDNLPALRKNFAGTGFTYHKEWDAFIPPQPFPSWSLNTETCLWEPPISRPTDGALCKWNEENQTWDAVNGN